MITGWVCGDAYDLFSDEEKASLRLPIGGFWFFPETQEKCPRPFSLERRQW